MLRVILALLGGLVLVTAATPTGRYLARAGWEESRILAQRRPITRLVADSAVPAATRAKLALVLEARAFAQDSLGLPAKDAFTQFTQLDRDTLVVVLSGARRDALVPVTWWFPIVGRVPYKGFFDVEEAQKAEARLQKDGFDTYLRPAAAFSTLGFFNDPVLSTTLTDDSVGIVQTVIHELTHNRIYLSGRAVFNESFAEFVGSRGAVEFFRARGDTVNERRAMERWSDELLLGRAWEMAYGSLDSAFRAHPDEPGTRSPEPGVARTTADAGAGLSARERRLGARDSVYARVRRLLVDSIAPRLRAIDTRYAERVRLDNAALLARRVYATGLADFEAVWEGEGRSARRALERVIAVTRGANDPLGALRASAARPR